MTFEAWRKQRIRRAMSVLQADHGTTTNNNNSTNSTNNNNNNNR